MILLNLGTLQWYLLLLIQYVLLVYHNSRNTFELSL